MSNKAAVRRYRGLFARRGRAARRVVVWYDGQPEPAPEPGVVVIHVSERVGRALDRLGAVTSRSPDWQEHRKRRTAQQVMDAEGDDIYRTVLERRMHLAGTDEERAALRSALDELLPEASAEASEDAQVRQVDSTSPQEASGRVEVPRKVETPGVFTRAVEAMADLVRPRDTFTGRLPDISLATGRPTGLRAEVERFRHAEGPESDALRDALQGLDDNAVAGRSGPVLWGEEYDDG